MQYTLRRTLYRCHDKSLTFCSVKLRVQILLEWTDFSMSQVVKLLKRPPTVTNRDCIICHSNLQPYD